MSDGVEVFKACLTLLRALALDDQERVFATCHRTRRYFLSGDIDALS